MRKLLAGAVITAAVLAGTAGTAFASDHNDHRVGPHHRVGFHHPVHHHKLSWWELLRLRLLHHHR